MLRQVEYRHKEKRQEIVFKIPISPLGPDQDYTHIPKVEQLHFPNSTASLLREKVMKLSSQKFACGEW